MAFLEPLAFIVLFAVAVGLFSKKAAAIRRNILLGQKESINDQPARRFKNMLLLALGQKKMFHNPLVAILHLWVYAGFIIINIEIVEIIIDGLTGAHRIFFPLIPSLYPYLINSFEVLAFLVLVACIIFLVRRNAMPIKRFLSNDLAGWPRTDANFILITEIVLMSLFLLMNASDTLLQQRAVGHYADRLTGNFILSSLLHEGLHSFSDQTLIVMERASWWLHIVGILAFLNYLPYSKHLHIVLAFPNAYYARLAPAGKMENMPSIQQEVLYAMQPELAPADAAAPQRFGARDVNDLSWKNLLDAYSCTECGRCSAACPARQTGKLLSPRKIMMDTRDRLEEVGRQIDDKQPWQEDGKSLLHSYISTEELMACTTCNACVEACPVSINPLDIILQLRRNLVMEESKTPAEWAALFSNVENNFAPWKFSPDDRDSWTRSV
ncbi:MAG: 4Fe-4S dicluster domain-containing protein [Sphingomonadales bacterium]|nr:(Fe-S)-binding protein [Sphingomonadales bacterium]